MAQAARNGIGDGAFFSEVEPCPGLRGVSTPTGGDCDARRCDGDGAGGDDSGVVVVATASSTRGPQSRFGDNHLEFV